MTRPSRTRTSPTSTIIHHELIDGVLTTVGTVRDGAKWPARDRRKGSIKRDRISFDVLSPYTVGRMIRGTEILKQYQQETKKNKRMEKTSEKN